MAFILTYDTLLQQTIKDLEREDAIVTGSFDRWVKNAHERIARDSPTLLFQVYLVGNFTVGQNAYIKPGRWQTNISWNYGSGTNLNTYNPIQLRSYEYCRLYSSDDSVTGPPVYYSDYGYNNWIISPTPDLAYPFELIIQETAQVIDATYQTNYMTEFMPEILEKAVMIEAMLTLKNDERKELIQNEYVALLSSFNAMDARRRMDRFVTVKAD